jgi:hypothetical protein
MLYLAVPPCLAVVGSGYNGNILQSAICNVLAQNFRNIFQSNTSLDAFGEIRYVNKLFSVGSLAYYVE